MTEILEDDKGRVKDLAVASSRDTSTSKPSKPYNGLLSHKSNSAPNQLLTPRQDTNEEEDFHVIDKDEVDISLCQHHNSSKVAKINKDEVNISVSLYHSSSKGAKMQHEFGSKNQDKNVCRLKECTQLQPQQRADQLLGKAVHNPHEFAQENGLHSFEQNLIPFGEQNRLFHPENQNQYPKLQQMNNLKTPATVPGVQGEDVLFNVLLQMMIPHLDKEKVMQLQMLVTRFDKKEISKDDVIKNMRNLVGGQMVKQAIYDLLMQQDHTEARAPQNSKAAYQKLLAQCENSLHKPQQLQQVNTEVAPTTTPLGTETNIMTPLIKSSIGLKKPLEALRTPSQASKKQKVTGATLDQSIEQFDDVTAVCGVNLMEEEAQLLPVPKEEHRATRRVVQEKEERLILEKVPFQKKMKKITLGCGIKNISKDVERCLSLCLEDRMRGLIRGLTKASKQRVDTERSRHRTIVTSDVRRQLLIMNRKAKEQAEEAEKLRILNQSKENAAADGEDKVETHTKICKEENIESKRKAANTAARAATGVDDIISRWQSITPLKRKENRIPPITAESIGVIRKCGKNGLGKKVARRISVEDVINVMERDPRMLKSTLLYNLYERRI